MRKYQIKRRIDLAINTLRVNDNYLLIHDVSERSIAHRLAMYLEQTFGHSHNVDCEYNRNIKDQSNSKKILVLQSRLNQINGDYCYQENSDFTDFYIEKSVFPDIIIHKRGSNVDNLVAIEIKKSSSRVSEEYDFEKLKCYTSSGGGNGLKYKYGIFIRCFTSRSSYEEPDIILFENGRISTWEE